MTVQLSVAVRNAMLDAIETVIGASPILRIRSTGQPANCAAADTGTLLAEIQLDADWAAAAALGSKAIQTLPDSDASADATGTAAHFRLFETTGTTCHMQGTVTATGGGGDLEIDNTSVVATQQVNLTSWSLVAGGA